MTLSSRLPCYDRTKTYEFNYDNPPGAVEVDVPPVPGVWRFCGLPVGSPLGVPSGPLLNSRWCLYYAGLGFDVLTYKTVRTRHRACYELPNLLPVRTTQLAGGERNLLSADEMRGTWAVSFGMPSTAPDVWRPDVELTKKLLPAGKVLSVSVVGTMQEGWGIDELADDYAQCARWAVDCGADVVDTNFSCPNVTTTDAQLYQQPETAGLVAQRVRDAIGDTKYIIKLGHITDTDSAEDLATAVAPHADALVMTNSIAATVVDSQDRPAFDGAARGICGDATREASRAQVRIFSEIIRRRGLGLEIIGVGGVSTAAHVHDYLQAGASAVHIATAAMTNPAVALEIRRDLAG